MREEFMTSSQERKGEGFRLVSAQEQAAQLKQCLPKSWTDVSAKHFPLFLTFRSLLELLDASLGPESFFRANPPSKVVFYEDFAEQIWPSLNGKLKKNYKPLTVFAEIMTHIKGSIDAMKSPGGRLSSEKYLSLAKRRAYLFDEQQRAEIYELFIQYESLKASRGLWDSADAICHMFEHWAPKKGVLFDSLGVDRIYVDEVQDLMEAEIVYLKFLCPDHQTGFIFAGRWNDPSRGVFLSVFL